MVCTCPGTALTRDRGSGRSMLGQSGHSATVSDLLGWSILLAREPDLDLEFEEQPHKHSVKQPAPRTPKQPGGKRGLLIVLLVMVIAGGAYFSSDPALLLELIDQVMGNLPVAPATPIPPRPPTLPATPPPPSPPPSTPAGTAPPASPAMTKPTATPAPGFPSPPSVEGPPALLRGLTDRGRATLPVAPAPPIPPTPPPSPAPPPPPPPAPSTPRGRAPPASPAMTKPTATPAPGLPSPLFVEGQRVMVFADPPLPPGPVPLTIEAEGTRSSFTIRPGATVTVVDGELRTNAWVYAVRTEDGAQGWLQEKRLKAKP